MAVPDKVLNVNDASFERWILRAEIPVALLFCTPRFARCQQLLPLWQELASQYGGRLRVAQMIVDDNRRWARHYRITALPTSLWLVAGEVRQRVEGVPSEAELRERAEALLAGREPALPERPERFSSAAGPVQATDRNFLSIVQDERPVLVDFWAAWCGPCRMVAPVLESLSRELGERVLIAKLNVDENPHTARRFNVMSIPTLMIFRAGQVVDTLVGAQPAPVIRQRLMAQLAESR